MLRSTHRAFRESLVFELLKDPTPSPTKALVPKQLYITKNASLPYIRLIRPIEIHRQIAGRGHIVYFTAGPGQQKKGRT